jgi:hypothetical protein
MDQVTSVLGRLGSFLGGLIGAVAEWIGPPTQWPPWAFAGLAVAGIMGVIAYVWNRTGKGMLIMLTLLVAFLVFVFIGVNR